MSLTYKDAKGESRLFINGELRDAISGKTYKNINPATEEVIGEVADAGLDDMELAIAAARNAFDNTDWSTNVELRVKCLRAIEAGLKKYQEQLRLQTIAEVGAPLAIVKGPQCDGPLEMIDWTINYLENFEWERETGTYDVLGTKSRHVATKEAAGVVAAITPWNFPIQIILAKIIPALAAGCTVILKAAPDTPWTATIFGLIASEIPELPPGVLNVITSEDPAKTGEMLCTDPRVDVISFTGSTQVGRQIMAMAAPTVKKVFLELGGKSANIVLPGAEFDMAILSNLGVCFHAGQGCAIATRLLVHKDQYDEAIEKLDQFFGFMTYGDPMSEGQLMGPLINKKQQDRVLSYIEKGIAEGARLVRGGKKPPELEKGFYVEPTIFADVTNDMTIAQEEIFGPVLCVIPFETEEEAIQIANDSIFGLSAMVWAETDEKAVEVGKKIRTGTVNINGGNFLGPDSPFGGYKQSGLGREMGVEGFEEYLETKTFGFKITE